MSVFNRVYNADTLNLFEKTLSFIRNIILAACFRFTPVMRNTSLYIDFVFFSKHLHKKFALFQTSWIWKTYRVILDIRPKQTYGAANINGKLRNYRRMSRVSSAKEKTLFTRRDAHDGAHQSFGAHQTSSRNIKAPFYAVMVVWNTKSKLT